MPALQRRHNSPNLRRAKATGDVDVHPMVKSGSHSSSEDGTALAAPKQLDNPVTHFSQLPARYESDEESVSPCPEDFEDAASSFSDIEIDSSLNLDEDYSPSIAEAKRMPIMKAHTKPILIDVSKLAPMEKRSTPAHVRPTLQNSPAMPMKTSIGRPIMVRTVSQPSGAFKPTVVALSKPPTRFRPPPPIPPRSGARVASPATPTAPQNPVTQQSSPFSLCKSSHTPRPSVSTISTRASMDDTDDGRSSIADSSSSSAPSSVADDADLAARYVDINIHVKHMETEVRKDSTALREQQDAELERAINDYMMWRNEGSPGEPPETVYKLSQEDKQMVRDHEEEEWRRELEAGLSTPTPTSYAAYDPYAMSPPSLVRPKAPFEGQVHGAEGGRFKGLRRGIGMATRAA